MIKLSPRFPLYATYFAFAVILTSIIIALPQEIRFGAFALVSILSLIIGLRGSLQKLALLALAQMQRLAANKATPRANSTSTIQATAEAATLEPSTEPSTAEPMMVSADNPFAYDPVAWPIWQRVVAISFSLLLMYIGQLQIYKNDDRISISSGYTLILVGLGAFYVLLAGIMLDANSRFVVPAKVQRMRVRWPWLVISVGLMAFVSWRSVIKPSEAYFGELIFLWVLSMFTFAIALSPLRSELKLIEEKPFRRWEWLLMLVLLVGAFAIRIYNINSLPYYYDNDEALFSVEGASFIRENFLITPFEPGVHSHPRLYQGLIGLSVEVLGATLLAARLPSVLLGTLTVVAVYLLGREMRDWQGGLIAALFTLTWAFAIQFSRLSMNQPADPLFGALAFYFLLRGLRRGIATDYAISGFMVGVAQLFYLGGRIIPLVMIAYLFYIYLIQRPVITKQWKLILIVPIAALLTTLPQNFFLLYNHAPLTTRSDPSILVNGQIEENLKNDRLPQYIFDQFRYSFLALTSTLDQSNWYGPESNLLGPIGGPVMLIGVVLSLLVLWKRPKWALPFGWGLAVVLGGGTLATSPPQYERYYPAVVAFSLIVEFGIAIVALAFAETLRRPEQSRKIAVGLGLVVAVANAVFYVGVYAPSGHFNNLASNYLPNRLGREAVKLAEQGYQPYFVGGFEQSVQNTLILQYFMSTRHLIFDEDELDMLIPAIDPTKPAAVFFSIQRKGDFDTFKQMYPDGEEHEVFLDEDQSLAFYLYLLPVQ